jgi:hypothetical protein
LLVGSLCLVSVARGQAAASPGTPTAAEEAAKANELAKMLANPVSNLWSLGFQSNNFELTNGRWNYNLNFQPVMPSGTLF